MTVIFQFPTAAPTTNPIIRIDPVLPDAGAKLLFDFKNPACFAGGAISGTLNNLVAGGANGTFSNAGAGIFDSASGGFSNNESIGVNGSTAFAVNLGAPYFTDLANSYLLIAWVTMPQSVNAGFSGTSFIFNSANSGGGATSAMRGLEFQFTTGGINTRVQGTFNSGTPANTPVGNLPNSGINQAGSPRLIQIAARWFLDPADNLWKVSQFFNNNLFGTAAYSPAQTGGNGIQNTSSNLRLFGGGIHRSLRVHRVYAEDLTVSGRSAAAVVATDWNFARNRFGVAA